MTTTNETWSADRKMVVRRIVTTASVQSRLYVNGGEDATLVAAKHGTTKGAEKWAARVLAEAR